MDEELSSTFPPTPQRECMHDEGHGMVSPPKRWPLRFPAPSITPKTQVKHQGDTTLYRTSIHQPDDRSIRTETLAESVGPGVAKGCHADPPVKVQASLRRKKRVNKRVVKIEPSLCLDLLLLPVYLVIWRLHWCRWWSAGRTAVLGCKSWSSREHRVHYEKVLFPGLRLEEGAHACRSSRRFSGSGLSIITELLPWSFLLPHWL